ncbi:gustatory receptor 8a isoform X1 [Drosophila mojavensis]|uniref:Gustatory receptor n=1 Tax=Drosophila mojavensis TaxID=7230 RepID=B4L8S8_DROMO|nr:gustatory receptor 8a isoform X1 [Drosophila mojavensis]EDW08053.1 uncharacterized protein Dmoj_GI14300, isoform A [Drosophila mojavensis]
MRDYRIDQVLHFSLRCYQLMGMHGLPLPCDAHPRRKARLLHVWTGCLLMGFSGVAYMCLTSDDEFLYKGDDFSCFNDAMKFGFAEMAILGIYWETLSSQRAYLGRFWQLYEALAATQTATTTPSGLTLRQQLVQHWRFLAIFYGTFLLELALLCVYVALQEGSRHLVLFWITFQPFILVVHLRNTQFVLHMDLLRQKLLQLECELILLVEYSSFANSSASFFGFNEYLRRRVREMQMIYARIHELCTCYRRGFSYSMLTVLLMIYIRITVDCYFFLYTKLSNITNLDYYLLLPAVLHIPAFLYTCQSFMQIVPRIAYRLHNIATSCSPVSLQIQNFSLQILHEQMRIDCMGIVILDNHLLTQIAYAVCTYMIFTVQLMPKLNGAYL